MNPNVSRLLAVVVRVGADPPAHFIVENQVTVLEPTESWVIETTNLCALVSFEIAIVIFPAGIVIRCSFPKEISSVAVPPPAGVYVCAVGLIAFITGLVIVGVVKVLLVSVAAKSLKTK